MNAVRLPSGARAWRLVPSVLPPLRPPRRKPPPGNRKGYFAVTVTGNRRTAFRFDGEHAYDIDFVDYHQLEGRER